MYARNGICKMNRISTFLITSYLVGIATQFVYLNFFHPIIKLADNTMFVLGLSLVWAIGKISPPWWVWLVALSVGIMVAFGDGIAQTTNHSKSE